jgi:hypothetical protein
MTVVLAFLWLFLVLVLPWLIVVPLWCWRQSSGLQKRVQQLEAVAEELRRMVAALEHQRSGQAEQPGTPPRANLAPPTGSDPATASAAQAVGERSGPLAAGEGPAHPLQAATEPQEPHLAVVPPAERDRPARPPTALETTTSAPTDQVPTDQVPTVPTPPVPAPPVPAPTLLSPTAREPAALQPTAAEPTDLERPAREQPALDNLADQPQPLAPPPPLEPPAGLSALGRSPTWRRLERLLIEHWTGIVGVLVVVAGITFLAINLALRLQPFTRFLGLLAAAALLAAPALLARRRPQWNPLASWMGSGAAALVLFACAASGGLPTLGLQWVDQPGPALALLCLAMGLNLALAAAAGTQTLAALHTAVNLLPLAIVPASSFSLVLASIVALVGQLLPRRRPWHGERLAVGLAYGLFLIRWCTVPGSGSEAPETRALAIGAAVVVFGAGALLPQRQRAGNREFSPLALLGQLLHWGGLTLVLLLVPQQLVVRLLGLAAAALVALLLGLRAQRRGWLALGRSQLLIGQTLFLAGLQSLDPLQPDVLLLALALLVESALFLRLAIRQADPLLQGISWGLVAGSGGWLLLAGLEAGSSLQASSVMLIAGSATTKLQRDLGDDQTPQPLPGLFSWWAALQFLVGAMVCAPVGMGSWLALGSLGTLASRSREPLPAALPEATATAVLLAHLIGWGRLLEPLNQAGQPLAAASVMLQLTPLMLLAATLVIRRMGLPLGIHLIGGSLLLAAQLLLAPINTPLPAIAWLLLSLLALQLARRLPRAIALPVLQQGLLALAIGLLAAITLPFSLQGASRLAITLLASGVLLRWWFIDPGDRLGQLPLWRRFHPYLLELNLLLLAIRLSGDVPATWQAPSWLLLALVLLNPRLRRWFEPRLQVWSVIAAWIGIALVMVRPEAHPLIAISLMIIYVVLSHRWLQLQPDAVPATPAGLGLLEQLAKLVARAPNPLLYAPLFVAMAVVLASHFDHSLLTLLWATEAFVIYVLSAVLRDSRFRVVALIALGSCLWRLVAVDMAQSDLTNRGVVFVGVGLLMLAMNALASRFRSRFR